LLIAATIFHGATVRVLEQRHMTAACCRGG